ncbi:unnamed protein product [Prorocentrum cordatum]|uniref:Glycosyltransferase family 2 protein n=1 Tax=Prorocentrum cordatum TaxID=2364126 RepID=A0ABN9Y4S9_9DINO|nr:unnamed protein product [Polarella glacialis]
MARRAYLVRSLWLTGPSAVASVIFHSMCCQALAMRQATVACTAMLTCCHRPGALLDIRHEDLLPPLRQRGSRYADWGLVVAPSARIGRTKSGEKDDILIIGILDRAFVKDVANYIHASSHDGEQVFRHFILQSYEKAINELLLALALEPSLAAAAGTGGGPAAGRAAHAARLAEEHSARDAARAARLSAREARRGRRSSGPRRLRAASAAPGRAGEDVGGDGAGATLLPVRRTASDPRVVVSLTTVPAGVGTLRPTLQSLRNQTFPADAIELNLPLASSRGLGHYPDLLPEDAEGVDVYRTDDWLALTNIVPTAQRAQQTGAPTLVIVVDDDRVYPSTLVEDHVRAFRERPRAASTCRGYRMPPRGDISPAVFFPAWDELGHSIYGHHLLAPARARRVAVVTGSDSWAVDPSLLGPELWQELASPVPRGSASGGEVAIQGEPNISRVAMLMNDIWVSGQLSRHGVQKYVVPCQGEARSPVKSEDRDRQNIPRDRRRDAMNEQVMRFFAADWLREELMPPEEIARQAWAVPELPPPPKASRRSPLRRAIGGLARAFFRS